MDELLSHHIRETERRFDETNALLERLEMKIENLSEFKLSMIASTRTMSFVISAVCGFITLVATVLLTYVESKH